MASAESGLSPGANPEPKTTTSLSSSIPAARTIARSLRPDGICVLTFDRPGSAANVLDAGTLSELAAELDLVEREPQLKGLVLASAKPSIFIAGADLNAFREGVALESVRHFIEAGQAVMNRLAALPIPAVAAIHGAALGGGCEICLACDYRVAAADRATRIGLPETGLGLLPAWGGSTRLPRLIGLRPALHLVLDGRPATPEQALALGLVDELTAAEGLLDTAVRKLRSGKRRPPNHWLLNNPVAAAVTAAVLRHKLLAKTRGPHPAVLKALEVMTRGLSRSLEESLTLEREVFMELYRTEASRNLVRLFFLEEHARKRALPRAPTTVEPKPITRAAVIGAGVMGAGIAHWLSTRDVKVALRDMTAERAASGMARISRLYQESLRRGLLTRQEMDNGIARIHSAAGETLPEGVELVIEAAFEDLRVKREIFQRLDERVSPETILASNTSALPIADIAAAIRRPERVVGLHFFNPVHRMALVEIVAGRQTAPEVLQRVLRFTQRIGKLPVLVRDSPGFVANRILTPYLNEAQLLFESGAAIRDLEEAMLAFGWPMGPLRLLDQIGLDVELHIAETLTAKLGERMRVPDCLRSMVQEGWLGCKSGRGFYLYKGAKRPRPNLAAATLIRGQAAAVWAREELQERLLFVMVNEAARCLEEEIVAEPEDIDLVTLKGLGFPPFRGGLLRYADSIGIERLVGAMEYLADSGATRFAPCALLQSMAAGGAGFYGAAAGRSERAQREAA